VDTQRGNDPTNPWLNVLDCERWAKTRVTKFRGVFADDNFFKGKERRLTKLQSAATEEGKSVNAKLGYLGLASLLERLGWRLTVAVLGGRICHIADNEDQPEVNIRDRKGLLA